MGIQAGISQFRIRYSELSLNDPSFLTGDISEWAPDFGAGLYYHTEKFYAGLSVPHMLHTYHDQRKASIASVPQYFMTMGYVFDISESIKLKPSYLLKRIKGNPLQLDMNCNVFLSQVLEVGLSWRSFESVSTMIQLQLNPRFSLGYAYDLPAGSELSKMSTGSHEMMLSYRTPQKKVRTVNPRYF